MAMSPGDSWFFNTFLRAVPAGVRAAHRAKLDPTQDEYRRRAFREAVTVALNQWGEQRGAAVGGATHEHPSNDDIDLPGCVDLMQRWLRWFESADQFLATSQDASAPSGLVLWMVGALAAQVAELDTRPDAAVVRELGALQTKIKSVESAIERLSDHAAERIVAAGGSTEEQVVESLIAIGFPSPIAAGIAASIVAPEFAPPWVQDPLEHADIAGAHGVVRTLEILGRVRLDDQADGQKANKVALADSTVPAVETLRHMHEYAASLALDPRRTYAPSRVGLKVLREAADAACKSIEPTGGRPPRSSARDLLVVLVHDALVESGVEPQPPGTFGKDPKHAQAANQAAEAVAVEFCKLVGFDVRDRIVKDARKALKRFGRK